MTLHRGTNSSVYNGKFHLLTFFIPKVDCFKLYRALAEVCYRGLELSVMHCICFVHFGQ